MENMLHFVNLLKKSVTMLNLNLDFNNTFIQMKNITNYALEMATIYKIELRNYMLVSRNNHLSHMQLPYK